MPMVGGIIRKRRADNILEAVQKEIDKRRSSLNNDIDVRSVTFVVKMKEGTETPRAAIMTVETEAVLNK